MFAGDHLWCSLEFGDLAVYSLSTGCQRVDVVVNIVVDDGLTCDFFNVCSDREI